MSDNNNRSPSLLLRRRITSNSTFNSDRANINNNNNNSNIYGQRTTLSVFDEDDPHQRRSRLYPGQSRQSNLTFTKLEDKLSPPDLDYSFTNGAKLIASVWFMMICILIFVVVVLMEKSNMPKGPESNPLCTSDGCRLVDNMITMNMDQSKICQNGQFHNVACGKTWNNTGKTHKTSSSSQESIVNSIFTHNNVMSRTFAQLINFDHSVEKYVSKMEYLKFIPSLMKKCVEATENDTMGQNQSKELSGHVLGVFEREGITNVPTFSAAYAAKYGFYPLFQMRLDYMVDMDLRDYTRQWSLDKFEEQIELFISPPEFRPIESEEDNILLSMFIDDYGSRQCTQQGIKNTLDALSSFVSVSPNNNRSCFGHSLPGAYTRKNPQFCQIDSKMWDTMGQPSTT